MPDRWWGIFYSDFKQRLCTFVHDNDVFSSGGLRSGYGLRLVEAAALVFQAAAAGAGFVAADFGMITADGFNGRWGDGWALGLCSFVHGARNFTLGWHGAGLSGRCMDLGQVEHDLFFGLRRSGGHFDDEHGDFGTGRG